MIVTIDGPAGAGKSSVSRSLANKLEFHFLDTGAMYRAIALAVLRAEIDLNDADAIAGIAGQCQIEMDDDHIWLNGEEISGSIRTVEVTRAIHTVADNIEVRKLLVGMQRQIACDKDYVTEGRDQGTIVFPDSCCKIFLTATPLERARRRQKELTQKGMDISVEQVLRDQNERDLRDKGRAYGRLQKASDAIEIVTDGKAESEVLQDLYELVSAARDAKNC